MSLVSDVFGVNVDTSSSNTGSFSNLFSNDNLTGMANILTNFFTNGLAGYGEDGFGLRNGAITGGIMRNGIPIARGGLHAVDETIGEISGRNRSREELYQAGQRAQEEEAKRTQLLADEHARQGEMDRSASFTAASRLGVMTSRGGVPTVMGDVAQGDLLGL